MRRLALVSALALAFTMLTVTPAQAIIHEIVASHCAAQDNHNKNVDPPGQLNNKGNSFARALQATEVYTFVEGQDQAGVPGVNFHTGEFGPLPAPPAGELAVTVFVDPEQRSAKLGDFLFWAYFRDAETFGEPVNVYLEIYEIDHPAFKHCAKLHAH